MLAGASDIRRTSVAVADMQARVVDLLGERSLMIGAISHDLRTLLTRMRLRAASLHEGRVRQGLERDLDGMDAMLADALAFARGTAASVRNRLDLADIAAAEVAERETRRCAGDRHRPARRTLFRRRPRVAAGGRQPARQCGDIRKRAGSVDRCRRSRRGVAECLAESGLGLAIVQEIVRAHGGSVTIADSPLGGAMVTVRIGCPTTNGPTSDKEQRH